MIVAKTDIFGKKSAKTIIQSCRYPYQITKRGEKHMAKWNVTLMAWVMLLGAVIFFQNWWFPLATLWRIASLVALFVGSFLLILNYNLRNFGKAIVGTIDGYKNDHAYDETSLVKEVLSDAMGFRRNIMLTALAAVVYVVAVATAAWRINNPADLFMYITGWALFCLIVDFQVRMQILRNIFLKTMSDAKKTNADTPAINKLKAVK